MSFEYDTDWDVERYKEPHESEEQWVLRKEFIETWKGQYPEDRLVCLARVFINMEFMGCRYPLDLMKEVARLSEEVAKNHRVKKKGKLQRTFVSASDAAEDRAKGVKRKGGIVDDAPQEKSKKINFVAQGQHVEEASAKESSAIEIVDSDNEDNSNKEDNTNNVMEIQNSDDEETVKAVLPEKKNDLTNYLELMESIPCLDVQYFRESMFFTNFGKLVLIVRPWMSKYGNLQSSCSACGLVQSSTYDNHSLTFTINGHMVAQATGPTKAEARSIVEIMAWNRLSSECITVVVKEQFIAQGDARISSSDVGGTNAQKGPEQSLDQGFGTPVESSIASKMMKMMGWSGGGLGLKSEGISEPIRPHLHQIHRAGLGSDGSSISDLQQLRRSATALMRRYGAAEALDVDLVFAADFTKEERAELHQLAKRCRLVSKSYGKDNERFLVVKKKLDPFSLVRAVIEKGGRTPKYQVYIPRTFQNKIR